MAKVSIVEAIRAYVAENERGCPKGVLLYTHGFSAEDIKTAQQKGEIDSSRGPAGGFFVASDIRPVTNHSSEPTLKGRMVDALRSIRAGNTVSNSDLDTLLSEYDAECKKRSESKKNAKK